MTEPLLLLRAYSVTVYGFMPVTCYASSLGKARAQVWREFTSSYPECSFHRFLTLSTVQKGRPEEGFGEKLFVEGESAYRVPLTHGGHYVGFVRPGSDRILICHPGDVVRAVPGTCFQGSESPAAIR